MVVARAPRDLRSETPGVNSTDNLRRVVKVKARAQHFAKPPQSGRPVEALDQGEEPPASGDGSGDGVVSMTTSLGAVPEPSTWVMMILGFVGLGYMPYRRKNGTLRFA